MYSYGSPHTAAQKQDDQHERTFSSCVRIQDVVLKTCLGRWTIGRSGERGSGISVLPARYDDDDDDIRSISFRIGKRFVCFAFVFVFISFHIFSLFMCFCMCVRLCGKRKEDMCPWLKGVVGIFWHNFQAFYDSTWSCFHWSLIWLWASWFYFILSVYFFIWGDIFCIWLAVAS